MILRCAQLSRQVAHNRDRPRVQAKPEVRMTVMIRRAQSCPLSPLGRGLGRASDQRKSSVRTPSRSAHPDADASNKPRGSEALNRTF